VKHVWAPGERVDVHLPLPIWSTFFAIAVFMLIVVAYVFSMDGMSRAQREAWFWLWFPGLVLAVVAGLPVGFWLGRLFFGSSIHLDWHNRTATIRGPKPRSFPLAAIAGVTTRVSDRHLKNSTFVVAEIFLVTASERLVVRTHEAAGSPQEAREADREGSARAGPIVGAQSQSGVTRQGLSTDGRPIFASQIRPNG
jgi:hypothetical protein